MGRLGYVRIISSNLFGCCCFTMDIDIDFVGEIGTSLLPEKVEIGFDYSFGQKDWSSDWKAQLDE